MNATKTDRIFSKNQSKQIIFLFSQTFSLKTQTSVKVIPWFSLSWVNYIKRVKTFFSCFQLNLNLTQILASGSDFVVTWPQYLLQKLANMTLCSQLRERFVFYYLTILMGFFHCCKNEEIMMMKSETHERENFVKHLFVIFCRLPSTLQSSHF